MPCYEYGEETLHREDSQEPKHCSTDQSSIPGYLFQIFLISNQPVIISELPISILRRLTTNLKRDSYIDETHKAEKREKERQKRKEKEGEREEKVRKY